MATISMKALLEAGVHFGHQTRRWNPKMSKYWFRWTFPRLRVDRLMQFCWKFLLPWSIANIGFAGLMILLRK